VSGLGPAALDRILEAGGVGDIQPEAKQELAEELESIRSLYLTGEDMRWKPATQRQGIVRITAAARLIIELIDGRRSVEVPENDGKPRKVVVLTDSQGYPWLAHHRAALNRLIADAEQGLFPPRITNAVRLNTESAFNNLVRQLYHAFAGYCEKIEPGFTTDPATGEVNGPFVALVDTALRELWITVDGRPYSRRTIAAAITNLKHKLR
jgi:hypothetical protein